MPTKKEPPGAPGQGGGEVVPDHPPVPKVEQPDPRAPQVQREIREEIDKEKLDP